MISDRSLLHQMGVVLNAVPQEDWGLRLFTNDVDPDQLEEDTVGRYVEMDGRGYAPIRLVGTRWSLHPGKGLDPPIALYPEEGWVFTGGGALTPTLVYGYLVTTWESRVFGWAERFADAPLRIRTQGDVIRLVPKYRLRRRLVSA